MGGIDLVAIGLGGLPFLYLISRVITKTIWPEMRPQLPIYGDYPSLPEEMRAATRKARGGEAASNDGPVTNPRRTHGREASK